MVTANVARVIVEDTLFALALAVAAWALGEAARSRRAAVDEAMRRAVVDEQARIARELHDVIAHSVSVVVVQAAAAGDVFDTHPDQARAALGAIEASGRQALAELRRLLAAVRTEGPDGPPQGPQPGLDRVEHLAEPFRAAGLDVVVTREVVTGAGGPRPLPAGVDVSAYRIVQEALTNTLRHARATTAEVTLRLGDEAVELEVVDDGRGHGAHTGPPGFGLMGMRERAMALGGTCEAGPTAHGGFRVHARLPVEPA
jgi:signal transduction histidine kinase